MIPEASSSPAPGAPKRVAIGSVHPAKVAAATAVLRQVFPHAEIMALSVDSGVGTAPTTAEETIRGALARAHRAMKEAGADLGIGIEDGIEESPYGTFLGGWAAIVDRGGRTGLGGGMRIALPPEIAAEARRGRDLGEVVRERSALPEVSMVGAIGWLTRRLVTREEAHRHAVAAALAPFLPGDVE